jgi:DNA-directed RNA polymerase beta' subunit
VFVNDIKDFGFKYATLSGLSISESDMILPENKKKLLEVASEKVKYIQKKHWNGFLTTEEKFAQSVTVWAQVKNVIEKEMK